MFYACMATLFCVSVGVTGLVLSFIDIDRFNFGLYLALLSVVGSTVSVAFWIISPSICRNPRCVQKLVDRYGFKLDPIRNYARRHFGTKKRKRRRKNRDDDDVLAPKPRIFETRFKKSKKGRSCSETEQSAVTTTFISQDRILESDCPRTTSSGYYSPAQTCIRIDESDLTLEAENGFLDIIDETVDSPTEPVIFVPFQYKKVSRLENSKSSFTIITTVRPMQRSNSIQTFV